MIIDTTKPLPPRIIVFGQEYSVLIANEEEMGKDDLWGLITHANHTIRISKDLDLRGQWDVLFHEVTHAILHRYYINKTLSDPEQELICNAIGNSIPEIRLVYA